MCISVITLFLRAILDYYWPDSVVTDSVTNTARGSVFKFNTFDFLNLSYFLMGDIVSQTHRLTSCVDNQSVS